MREHQGARRPERRIHRAILSPFAAVYRSRNASEAIGPKKNLS
jgi:hypothetical protein